MEKNKTAAADNDSGDRVKGYIMMIACGNAYYMVRVGDQGYEKSAA